MNIRNILPCFIACLSCCAVAIAQDRPIGYWRAHLPYNKAVGVASDGTTVFVAAEQSFYTINQAENSVDAYSKVDGMSDVGMSCIGYDVNTKTVVLAYKNSNIDLFKDGSFHNLPDLKLKTVTGSKKINNIYTENGLAYLATDIGIIVLNLDRQEVKESYTFIKNSQTIPVTAFTAAGNFFYAATPIGLYRANKNSISLQAFNTWTPIDTTVSLVSLAARADTVYTTSRDTVYVVEGTATKLKPVYYPNDSTLVHLDAGINGVWIIKNFDSTFNGKILKITPAYAITDSFDTPGWATQLLEEDERKRWIADKFSGLKRRDGPGDIYNTVPPAGPNAATSFDVYAYNKELVVAHGGYDNFWKFSNNGSGFSHFLNEDWKIYHIYDYKPFGDSMVDFTHVTKGADGSIYAASSQSGLFVLKPDGNYEIYKQGYFDESYAAPGKYRVSGLAFDKDGNLWMTVFGGARELVVKMQDGTWQSFTVPYSRPFPHSAAHLIIDDNNLKWYACPQGGGAMVYDDGGTPANPVDDRYRQLVAGKGIGNLPDNEVYCLAKDKNGAIWIGTSNGIGIVNCPAQVIDGSCEAEIRIVQYDEFAGYLFANEIVKALAVDGANRKWVGTNNGVWLLSPEGDKIIYRFTAANSPLPSNSIQKIAIDPITGDVYISTDDGLVSYRSTAVEGGEKNEHVVSFPNPVPSGYKGSIAIKGLVENADVRITDVSGQLVYRTKAFGGQAVWNGTDYTGRRPQSGVYLIFITNKDGSQTHVGKMVFME